MASNNRSSKIINFIKKHKKKIIALVILLTLIIIIIIYFSLKKDKNVMKNVLEIDELTSNNPQAVPNCEISRPKNGSNFSCSFWIKINKFYENHRYWRHIFHKGTEIHKENVMEYDTWENISTNIPEQYPGLWMNPINNNLRICFTTEITNDYEPKTHPNPSARPIGYDNNPDNVLDVQIEYFDIKDIQINKYVNICWILDNQTLDVYIDLKLTYTFTLSGRVLVNNGSFYFNYPRTINADIKNFRLIPKKITKKDMKIFFENNPTF